ncbi:hypothetical protein PUN28_013982 [Cardiocondyla obscurior]
MQAASNVMLKNITERLKKIEAAIKNRGQNVEEVNDNLIAPFLPLNAIDIVKEFDALLKMSHDTTRQFKHLISKTGGNNARDGIHRIFKKTFTNECAMKCSWKGHRNNFQVSNLHLTQIIKRQVIMRFTTCTEGEFDFITAEWFRFAQQRYKREKSKEIIMEENTEDD